MSGTSNPGKAGPNPFVGPRSIQQGEALYGRSAEVRELYNRLQARRIAVLHSPSGAGKSSLVQAGLIPRLKQANFDVWKPMRVNLDPRRLDGIPDGTNRYLLSTMISLEEELPKQRRRSPAQLAKLDFLTYLDTRPRRKRRGDSSVVLLFDQFEEVLTIEPRAVKQKHEFFTAVGHALDTGKYWALFIIREDFLAAFAPYRDRIPTQMANTFRLDLLGLEGAREAAEQLALVGGRAFPAVDQLIRDLSTIQMQQPDGSFVAEQGLYVEPVHLQVVGRRLWQAMPEDDLSIDAQDIAAYAGVSEALAVYYSQAVEKIAQGDLAVERSIREWVGSGLIVGGIRSQVRQEAGSSGGLDNTLITELLGVYLVRSEPRAGSNWFELSHDRLVEPVQTDNERWEQEHLHALQVQAKLWEDGRRAVTFLLSAEALPGALLWAVKNAALMTDAEQEFLRLSGDLRAAEAKERVRSQFVRRVFGIAAICSAILAVITSVGVVWATKQKREAVVAFEVAKGATAMARQAQSDLEKNEAQIQRMLSEQRGRRAQMLIPDNLEGRALMLAIQAVGVFADLTEAPPDARKGLERVLMNDNVIVDDSLVHVSHPEAITQIAYAPHDDRVASACDDGTAVIWDASTGTSMLTLRGHTGKVAGLAYAPSGDHIATAGHDKTARIWNASTGELLHELEGHKDVVAGIAYSPDGAHLATASWDKTARIWDTSTGALVHKLAGHTDVVSRVVYSADGAHLATISKDATTKIWDPYTGELQRTLVGHGERIHALAYAPDQSTLATGSSDNTARIWDLGTGKLLHTLEGHRDYVFALVYSPDGSALATASNDDTVRIWNSASGELQMTLTGHEGGVRSVVFSADGSYLVSASRDSAVRVWEVATGRVIRTFIGPQNEATQVVFAPSGDRIASASLDGSLRIWAFETDSELSTIRGHQGPVEAAAYSPNALSVATASDDGTARIWGSSSGELIRILAAHDQGVRAIMYSSSGAQLATAGRDHTARIWDPNTGEQLWTLEGHTDSVELLVYSPNGDRLATASLDNTTKIWNPETGALLATLANPKKPSRAIAYSPDSAHLATASEDYKIRIWNATSGALEHILPDHTGYVHAVAYSPLGDHLVSGSGDGHAHIWDSSTGKLLEVLEGHKNIVCAVAYAPDGVHVATASADRSVKIWDTGTGKPVTTLSGHTNEVWSITYSPDGARLATAGKDSTARLWDPLTGKLIMKFEGHLARINDLRFSPDGTTLVTPSDDHTAKVWNVRTGQLQVELEDRLVRRRSDGAFEWPVPLPTLLRVACERLERVGIFADDYHEVARICAPLLGPNVP